MTVRLDEDTLGRGPNQYSQECLETLRRSRPGQFKRTVITKADEDDPQRAAFLDQLLKRTSQAKTLAATKV